MMCAIPDLCGERLILRAFRCDDLDDYAEVRGHPDVARYLLGAPLTRAETWGSMAALTGLWGLRGYGMFAVEEASSKRVIGHAGILHHFDWPDPEIAYALHPSRWGRGYATESARLVRDWAFAEHDFVYLASFIMPANTRSIRVAERLGAIREGDVRLRGIGADRWIHRRG